MWFLFESIELALTAVVPIFQSYKAVKKGAKVHLLHWLKYWTVFGVVKLVTTLLELTYLCYLIPFYSLLRFLISLSIVSPYGGGAQFCFDKILSPFIRKYERRMDKAVSKALPHLFFDLSFPFLESVQNALMFLTLPAVQQPIQKTIEYQEEEEDDVIIEKVVNMPSPDVSMRTEEESDDEIEYVESVIKSPVSERCKGDKAVKTEPIDTYQYAESTWSPEDNGPLRRSSRNRKPVTKHVMTTTTRDRRKMK